MYADLRRQSMDSNSVQGHDLRSSAWCISFARCHSNHSVFVRRTKYGSMILTVYVKDKLLIENDSVALAEKKKYLKRHFMTKDMGKPKYFLRIEISYQKHGLLLLSQRKYALDLLKELTF